MFYSSLNSTPQEAHDYSIYLIGNIRTLVEVQYADGTKGILEFDASNKIEEKIEIERKYFAKRDFKVLTINKFPHSKRVILISNKKSEIRKKLLVKEDTQPQVYDLLDRFSFGAFMNGKETRYKNVFQVYEFLEESPEYKFVAIRHALSHPRITKDKTITAIKSIFGDDRINFKKHSHYITFKSMFDDLEKKTHLLLVQKLLEMERNSIITIGNYKIV